MHHIVDTRLPRSEATAPSLDASDDFDALGPRSYCPKELLGAFTLLMSGHGRCVSAAMMLGDREYAMWQLARAHTLADRELRSVAARLFAYFEDAGAPAPAGLRA